MSPRSTLDALTRARKLIAQLREWSDGDYPTDAALDKIAAWPIATVSDCSELLRFIQPIWHFGDWGWNESEGYEFDGYPGLGAATIWHLSTGGWSGNESIIGALLRNQMFWSIAWCSSRRGGHFEFRVPRDSVGSGEPPA